MRHGKGTTPVGAGGYSNRFVSKRAILLKGCHIDSAVAEETSLSVSLVDQLRI